MTVSWDGMVKENRRGNWITRQLMLKACDVAGNPSSFLTISAPAKDKTPPTLFTEWKNINGNKHD